MAEPVPALEGEVELFATAARGTEVALRDELRSLRFFQPKADRGGVRFNGTLRHAFEACLRSRIALRVLVPLGKGRADNERAYYDAAHALPLEAFVGPDQTLACSAVSRNSKLRHTGYLAQLCKDAIVDRLRDRSGARPDVDRSDPDVAIFIHVKDDVASFFLDAAGRSLHERGYRLAAGPAPLKETLAAAMIRLSGWDGVSPLVDPMCGAGTIPIEADLFARDVAPGIFRDRFGIERWACVDATLRTAFEDARGAARARAAPVSPAPIVGSDVDPRAIERAYDNARRASATVRFETRALSDVRLPAGAFVVTNPPYGERLEEHEALLGEIRALARRSEAPSFAILFGQPLEEDALPARARRMELWNGDLPCQLAIVPADRGDAPPA